MRTVAALLAMADEYREASPQQAPQLRAELTTALNRVVGRAKAGQPEAVALQRWPDPHPRRGPALDRTGFAKLMGYRDVNTVSSALARKRSGSRVPLVEFPDPDGFALHPNGHQAAYWWRETVVTYRAAMQEAQDARKVGLPAPQQQTRPDRKATT